MKHGLNSSAGFWRFMPIASLEVSFDLIMFGLNLGGILGGGEMVAGNFDLREKGGGGRGGGSGI